MKIYVEKPAWAWWASVVSAVVIIFGLGILVWGVAARAGDQKILEVQGIRFVNLAGKQVGYMGVSQGGGCMISFTAPDGTMQFRVMIEEGGSPAVFLRDPSHLWGTAGLIHRPEQPVISILTRDNQLVWGAP